MKNYWLERSQDDVLFDMKDFERLVELCVTRRAGAGQMTGIQVGIERHLSARLNMYFQMIASNITQRNWVSDEELVRAAWSALPCYDCDCEVFHFFREVMFEKVSEVMLEKMLEK